MGGIILCLQELSCVFPVQHEGPVGDLEGGGGRMEGGVEEGDGGGRGEEIGREEGGVWRLLVGDRGYGERG